MFGIGMTEILIVLIIVLVVFGARKLPEIGTGLGKGIKSFKAGVSGREDSQDAKDDPRANPGDVRRGERREQAGIVRSKPWQHAPGDRLTLGLRLANDVVEVRMKDFFNVATPAEVLAIIQEFEPLSAENVPTAEALGRVLAEDIRSPVNLPDFDRATMDGFAVRASETTGASESSAIQLEFVGNVRMGEVPDFEIGRGQTAKIPTGGMLPKGRRCRGDGRIHVLCRPRDRADRPGGRSS